MERDVFGFGKGPAQAQRILERLCRAGFGARDISVLYTDAPVGRAVGYERHTMALEGADGAFAGGVLGGVGGWLVGSGTLTVPGLGPVVAAGPILAALSSVATAGLADALVHLGVAEPEARRCEEELREGRILISVRADGSDERIRAEEVFESASASDAPPVRRRSRTV